MLQEQLGKLGVDLVNNLEDLLASTSDGVDRIVAKLASENHCLRREL